MEGFKDIDLDVTEKDRVMFESLRPFLLRLIYGKQNSMKAPYLVQCIIDQTGMPFTDTRLRKMVNYLRRTAALPIIATSNGYYITENAEEIRKEIISMRERASSIISCAIGLEHYLKTLEDRVVPTKVQQMELAFNTST